MGDLSLYVHWPFCQAKCPYCDFNSHVAASVDHAAWARALVADLRHQAGSVPDRRLRSIFFGGGTPSLMDPETVAAVIDAARATWPVANDLEISMEANPTSVEAGRFRAFRDAGVGRVSVGIQALRDDDLRRLGRTHDASQARAAYDVARATFERVSFDLIYARQDQDEAAWRAELGEALAMGPDHLSVYQLTIEDGTVFARRHAAGRLPGLPDEDAASDLYLMTNAVLSEAGLPAYEVSNHARPGAECRHNLAYWRAGDWLGVGPGAHGRYGRGSARRATVAARDPAAWLAAVGSSGCGLIENVRDADHATEYLLGALRLREGLDLGRLAELGLEADRTVIDDLEGDGLIMRDGAWLRPTMQGLALADAVIGYIASRARPIRDNASQTLSKSFRSL
jgi:oxygen-independent coproporphyrinogen-3 oxidase